MLQKQQYVAKVALNGKPVKSFFARAYNGHLMEKLGNARFARYAWGVLAYNVAVSLWGAFVRATGSGAGCGNHWPLCNGGVTPHSQTLAAVIEFTHRATSGVSVVLVAILAVWAFRAFPRFHPARLGATLSMIFLLTEALLGAMLVLLDHVAKNPSTARGYSLSTHLINTLTLLACLTLTAWWASGHPRLRAGGRAAWMAAISLGVVMLMGVTGAIAALGDTLFPAQSLAQGFAQDLDPGASIFLRLRLLHPMIAAIAAAWLIFYATPAPAPAKRYAWTLCGLLAAQLTAGILNLLLLAPVWLQMVHLLLAYSLWITLVLLCAETLTARQPS
jgi:heme A synthase